MHVYDQRNYQHIVKVGKFVWNVLKQNVLKQEAKKSSEISCTSAWHI